MKSEPGISSRDVYRIGDSPEEAVYSCSSGEVAQPWRVGNRILCGGSLDAARLEERCLACKHYMENSHEIKPARAA